MNQTRLSFFTNLDEAQPYVRDLNAPVGHGTRWAGSVPAVGNEILFRVHANFAFRLRVCSVTWMAQGAECQVELHLPLVPARSIADWVEWFKRHEPERA